MYITHLRLVYHEGLIRKLKHYFKFNTTAHLCIYLYTYCLLIKKKIYMQRLIHELILQSITNEITQNICDNLFTY